MAAPIGCILTCWTAISLPNLSMGPVVVEALRPLADETGAILDVHLMITQPDRYLADFAGAGADNLTVHAEAGVHLHRTVQAIKELGCTAGVALNPATPLVALEEILPDIDLALIMSVNPGFNGQSYIPGSTARIGRLRQMLDAAGSRAWLEVDGGVKPGNVGEAVAAGATALVAATAIYQGRRLDSRKHRRISRRLVVDRNSSKQEDFVL